MTPIWLRATYRSVEAGVGVSLLLLGALLIVESAKLGSGWGESGPLPGFFPFSLTVLMLLGTILVLYANVYRNPDLRPFFEVAQEVVDLLKVGIPVVFAIALIHVAGLYVTSGIYLAFFMAWYGKFRWYYALFGGVIFPTLMWLLLREGFNIAMPMSMFYRKGILPF
jgi:putative tricarboxylic transport membrane protein